MKRRPVVLQQQPRTDGKLGGSNRAIGVKGSQTDKNAVHGEDTGKT